MTRPWSQVRECELTVTEAAAKMRHEQYVLLRNTVRVIRGSGVPLSPYHQERVCKFEATIRAYETRLGLPAASAPASEGGVHA